MGKKLSLALFMFVLFSAQFSLAQTMPSQQTAQPNFSAQQKPVLENQSRRLLFDYVQDYLLGDEEFNRSVFIAFQQWKNRSARNLSVDNIGQNAIIVMGSNLNGIELAVIESMKERHPMLAAIKTARDSEADAKALAQSGKLILLVGGPSQNKMTRQFMKLGWLEKNASDFRGQIIVNYGKTPGGAPIIAISDGRGYRNLARISPLKSIFSRFIPEKFVPAAATMAGVFLLGLPVILGALSELLPGYLRAYLGKYLQFLGKGRNEINEKFAGFTVAGFALKLREFLAIFFAACVFGIGMAYLFSGEDADFASVAAISFFVSSILYLARELSRLAISHHQKLKTEFYFWPLGSLVTLASAFLGSMCNATYYILEEKGEGAQKKSALMKIFVEVATIAAAAVFFMVNLASPDSIWQMFFVSASTLGAIETLPIKPLPGSAIKGWNNYAWFATFVAVWGGYILLNFVL